MPPLSTTAPNPAGLAAWREMAGDATRITLNEQSQAQNASLLPLGGNSTEENQAAFDNLFTSIHGSFPEAAPAVRELLEGHLDAGLPLTGRLVQMAMHMVEQSAAQLCDKWDVAANSINLSPREVEGLEAYFDFQTHLGDRLLAADAVTPADRLVVLDAMLDEIRTAPVVGEAVKDRFIAYTGMAREQAIFERDIANSPSPELRNMALPGECWKLVMDGSAHGELTGIVHFENECGYMHGMLKALNHMLAHVQDPVTAQSYGELHDIAVGGVHERNHVGPAGLMKQGFRDGSVGFGLVEGSNMSRAGLLEFARSPQRQEQWCIYRKEFKTGPSGPVPGLRTAVHTPEQCKAKAGQIIAQYHREVEAAPQDNPQRETAILRAIAKCCKDLDQHHLFSDGNIRTVAFLLMNKLLIQNEMSPTMFMNPNAIDMHSTDEIVELMRQGQTAVGLLSEAEPLDDADLLDELARIVGETV
jgi:hypothetical protein